MRHGTRTRVSVVRSHLMASSLLLFFVFLRSGGFELVRIRTLPAATALAVLFSSAVLAVTPAYADTKVPVAVQDDGESVVDALHQRLLFSGSDKILVTDYSGATVATLTGLPQVRDLALSWDGTTLYAAVQGADKIVAFDTATLDQTAEYPTGEGTGPAELAYSEGRLWFGYGENWDSGIGAVDLTAETPTVTLGLGEAYDWSGQPMLYTDADNPGMLLGLDGSISSAPMVVYDISSGTPVLQVSAEPGGFHKDAELKPDGRSVVVAGPGNRALTEYRLSDLQPIATYPVADEPEMVSIAPDGTVAATVMDTSDSGDTYVFSHGPEQPPSVRNLSSQWMPWFGHTLNWSHDGSRLFALTDTYEGGSQFHRVDAPRTYLTTLKVQAPATASRAKALTVTGSLTSGLALPAGTPLTVTRTDLESPSGKSLGTKTLGANGQFSFTDTPPAGGKVTYTVKYAGDDQHTAASATAVVTVSRATPTLTLSPNGKVYDYRHDVPFTAHLGTTYKNRTVEIWVDRYGADMPAKLVKKGTVNSAGNISVTLDMPRDATITAKFAGDARYASRSVNATAYARVDIGTWLTNHYAAKYNWGHTYQYFRQSKDPLFSVAMTPYPGRKQRLQLQYAYDGAWHDNTIEYFALDAAGKSRVNLTGTPPTGIRFRIRSSYVNSYSGDTVNSTTSSAWKYFIFTG